MFTQVTEEKIREFNYPVFNWVAGNKVVDSVEMEIMNVEKVSHLLGEGDRIIAYVHFDAGTECVSNVFLTIRGTDDETELDMEALLNEKEVENIKNAAIISIRKWRKNNKKKMALSA